MLVRQLGLVLGATVIYTCVCVDVHTRVYVAACLSLRLICHFVEKCPYIIPPIACIFTVENRPSKANISVYLIPHKYILVPSAERFPVVVRFTLDGSVDDFDRADFITTLADLLGVTSNTIDVRSVVSGSVIVTAGLSVSAANALDAVDQAALQNLGDPNSGYVVVKTEYISMSVLCVCVHARKCYLRGACCSCECTNPYPLYHHSRRAHQHDRQAQ